MTDPTPSATPLYFDPYSRIERAIVARLSAGLAGMVREVASYGGQLDDDPARIVSALPAAWVTFGGVLSTARHSTARKKWRVTGRYVVIVGQANARSEVANRHGSGRPQELGTNALVWAVRRLLSEQDLIDQDPLLKISGLEPGRVRTVFNTIVDGRAMSVFACEFDTTWIEHSLPNGRFPSRRRRRPSLAFRAPDDDGAYDELFDRYPPARKSQPYPWLETIGTQLFPVPPQPGPDTLPGLAGEVTFTHDEDDA